MFTGSGSNLKGLAVLIAVLLSLALTGCNADSSTDKQIQATDSAKTANLKTTASLNLNQTTGFDRPVEIKAAPGFPRLMFVVEQSGLVKIIRNGRKVSTPFLNIQRFVDFDQGESGLLSIAFPKHYRKSRLFYVYYNDRNGDIRVDEFKRAFKKPLRANPFSRRKVIIIPHPDNSNHNGGTLNFLGNALYFATGDGGGGGDPNANAQNKNSLLGKMIRIYPYKKGSKAYTVPRSNPYVGKPGLDQIFAIGLRNPFRWSFDLNASPTRMIVADVGQDEKEEINAGTVNQARGANFGWNSFEGDQTYNNDRGLDRNQTVKPVLVLPRSEGYCSVIGGTVAPTTSSPEIRGRYLFSDLCNSGVKKAWPRGANWSERSAGINISGVTSFALAANKTIWVSTLEGTLYRFR